MTGHSEPRERPPWPSSCTWRYCTGAVGAQVDGSAPASGPADCAKSYPACQICETGREEGALIEQGAPLEHRVYHDFKTACETREAWDALAAAEGDFFSSFDWCAIWWQHYGDGRHLEIHVFIKGNALVGAIPLFRERVRVGPFAVQVVRIVGSDHSTACCHLNLHHRFAEEVLQGLFRTVLADGDWDLVHLGRLPGYFRHVDLLARVLRNTGRVGKVEKARDPLPQTVIDLPKSYEEYLEGLSSRERHNIRKETRRLVSEHTLISKDLAEEQDVLDGLEQFIEFHQSQWTEKGERGHFEDWPGSRAFHRDLALVISRAGRLCMRQLLADGHPLGMVYSFYFGSRMYYFLTARSTDPRWHFCWGGRVAACEVVRKSIERGATQMEMGVGYYLYKLKLGGKLYPVMGITAVRAGVWPALKVWMLRKLALLRDLLGYRLWYLRIEPRLSFVNKAMSRRWIRTRMWPSDTFYFARCVRSIWQWPLSLLVRARRRMREAQGLSGYWEVVVHQFRRSFLRRELVFSLDPAEPLPDISEPAGFEAKRYRMFYEVDEAEQNAITSFGGKFLWLRFECDLQRGNELWIAHIGGEAVGVGWAARAENLRSRRDHLRDADVIIQKCFTLPKFRNRGVFTALLQRMVTDLRASGAERIFIKARSWNEPSISAIEKAGFFLESDEECE